MRVTLSAAVVIGLTALAIGGQATATAAPVAASARHASARHAAARHAAARHASARHAAASLAAIRPGMAARPAISGREVFKIVSLAPDVKRPKMAAKGAFTAKGYFIRRLSTAVFPAGRIKIRRYVLRTSYYGPDLRTCRFKIWQKGTFRLVRATGRYAGIRENGDYWTTISGRLRRVATDECSSKIVGYRSVTFEIGTVRR